MCNCPSGPPVGGLGILLVVPDQEDVAWPKVSVLDCTFGEGQYTAEELRVPSPQPYSKLCFRVCHKKTFFEFLAPI